ncbi:MAG: hypothetical protein J0H74_33085 [Chitinophagaceae bacterium]|nr:hypothetical protein [Chitinophagaceae bacterium]
MKWKLICTFCIICFIAAQSFNLHTTGLQDVNTVLSPKLSDFQIYSGKVSDLTPAEGFIKYELAAPLFTDYAEKERLIKVPAGTSIGIAGDGLPSFPNGTMLVKTFFYWKDKRDPAKGKRIIETRLLIKANEGWLAGTYVWNNEQNEAVLTNSGLKTGVNWIDKNGEEKNINYQVPTIKQCGTCHNSQNEIIPIGFKIRNLNITVTRNNIATNQLQYFAGLGIANAVNPLSLSKLPSWNDDSFTPEQRVRAYLEVNCAHCHNNNGFCSASDFRPAYENSLSDSKILEKRKRIVRFIRSGRMPLLGTTIVHQEGLQLIENYLNTLK